MVRRRVGIGYFPFFLGADFLAGAFFAAALACGFAFAAVFLAGAFFAAALVFFTADFFLAFDFGSPSSVFELPSSFVRSTYRTTFTFESVFSFIGAIASPSAADSISTTSDQ